MARTRGASNTTTPGKTTGGSASKTVNKGRQGKANVIDSKFKVPTTAMPGNQSMTQSQIYRLDRASAFGGGTATNQS